MRVLVTGGAGFIGSHLTDAFLARGDEVIVVDDLSTGRAGRLDDPAWLHKLSITDAVSLGEIVRGTRPELICHLASHIDVRTSVDAPAQDAQVNVVGTVNVLEAARGIGARVLFASSGGILYGRNAAIPSREDVLPLPGSPVGIAKYCAEQYIGLYNRLHGTRHSVLRLANVYGPRQDPAGEAGVIPIFCGGVLAGDDPTLYGDGSQTRDYVYVGDAVSAFLAAADAGRPGTWNIGTGVEISVLDIVAIIGEVAGHLVGTRPGEPRPGELLRSSLAVDRAARDLDWQARTPADRRDRPGLPLDRGRRARPREVLARGPGLRRASPPRRASPRGSGASAGARPAEREPDRVHDLGWYPGDLGPGEVHDLVARGAQPRVALQLGTGPGRSLILERPVGLADRAVSPPQEVHPADDLAVITDPDLQVRRGETGLVEHGPAEGLQHRLRSGVTERGDLPGPPQAPPPRAVRDDRGELPLRRQLGVHGRVGDRYPLGEGQCAG